MLEDILRRLFGSKKEKFELEPVLGEGGELEEYWVRYRKDEIVNVSEEQAVEIAHAFVAGKNITFPMLNSLAELTNNHGGELYTCQEKNFFSSHVKFLQRWGLKRRFGDKFDTVPVIFHYSFPGEYQVTLSFQEGDVSHTEKIYISSQNGKIRTCGYFEGKECEITSDYIAKQFAHKQQYYVLMYVKDGQVADGILEDLKQKEGVEAIHYGPRELIDNDFADAAFSRLREGSYDQQSPLETKTKHWKREEK